MALGRTRRSGPPPTATPGEIIDCQITPESENGKRCGGLLKQDLGPHSSYDSNDAPAICHNTNQDERSKEELHLRFSRVNDSQFSFSLIISRLDGQLTHQFSLLPRVVEHRQEHEHEKKHFYQYQCS